MPNDQCMRVNDNAKPILLLACLEYAYPTTCFDLFAFCQNAMITIANVEERIARTARG